MSLRIVSVNHYEAKAFIAAWHRRHRPPQGMRFAVGVADRAAKAMGYGRLITYTQAGETGSSLRAAGWVNAGRRHARPGWNVPSRPRDDGPYLPADRLIWVVESEMRGPRATAVSRPVARQEPASLFEVTS